MVDFFLLGLWALLFCLLTRLAIIISYADAAHIEPNWENAFYYLFHKFIFADRRMLMFVRTQICTRFCPIVFFFPHFIYFFYIFVLRLVFLAIVAILSAVRFIFIYLFTFFLVIFRFAFRASRLSRHTRMNRFVLLRPTHNITYLHMHSCIMKKWSKKTHIEIKISNEKLLSHS